VGRPQRAPTAHHRRAADAFNTVRRENPSIVSLNVLIDCSYDPAPPVIQPSRRLLPAFSEIQAFRDRRFWWEFPTKTAHPVTRDGAPCASRRYR